MRAFDKNLKYNLLFINASEEVDDKIDEEITEELSTYTEKYGGYLNSIYENHQFLEKQKMLEIVTIVSILIICFAVSHSIINNAMSARIRENKREIGTLRAVGADERALPVLLSPAFISPIKRTPPVSSPTMSKLIMTALFFQKSLRRTIRLLWK